MTTSTPAAQAVLTDAAFGDTPGRWPLPAAATAHQLWLRAVVAGGQGRYGGAIADLDALRRTPAAGAAHSLGHSTRASFMRQLGGHVRARSWDGRAWATADGDTDAGADALIGLAADALGIGRFGVSDRLLQRAAELVEQGSARLPVRLGWVRAELAMTRGDGAAAVGHAEEAVARAVAFGSARHGVKSAVVLAAALASAGATERSREVADAAFAASDRYGLVPLRWAVCCLLAEIGSAEHSPERVVAAREQSADTVRRRGGVWTDR